MRTLRASTTLTLATLPLRGCGHTITGTRTADVSLQEARWQARGIASYRYDYSEYGFYNTCPQGPLRVYVRADVVDSATIIATGAPVPASGLPCVPTIDGLFQGALAATRNGTLQAIRYDGSYGYPAEIDISGPPDASGRFERDGFATGAVTGTVQPPPGLPGCGSQARA